MKSKRNKQTSLSLKDNISQIIDNALREKLHNLGYTQMQPSAVEFVNGTRELLENGLVAGLSDTTKSKPKLALRIANDLVEEIITKVEFSGDAISNKDGAKTLQIRDDAFSMALGDHELKVMDQGDGAHNYQEFERDATVKERLAHRIDLLVNPPKKTGVKVKSPNPESRLYALLAEIESPRTPKTQEEKEVRERDVFTENVVAAMQKARSPRTLQNLAIKGGIQIAKAANIMSKFNPMKFFKKSEEAKVTAPPASPDSRGRGRGKDGGVVV